MTDLTYDTRHLAGRTAVDRNYSKIGTIDEVYVNDATAQPGWLAIKTGLFGANVTSAPLSGALAYGDEVVVPYDSGTITEAPNAEDLDHLSSDEVVALYDYYGLGRADGSVETADRPRRHDREGDHIGGPQTETFMTRSEEHWTSTRGPDRRARLDCTGGSRPKTLRSAFPSAGRRRAW